MADPEDFDFRTEAIHESDIERYKSIVSRYFTVYDIRWNEKTTAFFVNYIPERLEEQFEQLYDEPDPLSYVQRVMEKISSGT